MLKKTIEYTDYNDVERKEDFYFNLTKAELMELELGTTGGLGETIKRIIDTQDMPSIIKIFKDLVLKAYGVKSPDGKRMIKNDEVRDEFAQSPAYSELFMELATNAEAAAKFVNGIVPKDLADELAKETVKALPNK